MTVLLLLQGLPRLHQDSHRKIRLVTPLTFPSQSLGWEPPGFPGPGHFWPTVSTLYWYNLQWATSYRVLLITLLLTVFQDPHIYCDQGKYKIEVYLGSI